MEIIRTINPMKDASRKVRALGKSVGFVPTMGALHEGHLSLVKKSKAQNDVTVISIFVNPIQFGPQEDYLSYPRNLEKDLQTLNPFNPDFVFAPEAREMFPPGFQTRVDVEHLSKPLCGMFRPGHFQGVATVVLKLFNIVMPHRAYFGEKDYQQLQVVKQMVQDLNLDIEIVPCPIVREKDGLAMSSRNAYLSSKEREAALILYQALQEGKIAFHQGEKKASTIRNIMSKKIQEEPLASLEYAEVVHPETLQSLEEVHGKALLALAVRIGKARLIDNLRLEEK
jgi:pantoate--beta-alanine ligase